MTFRLATRAGNQRLLIACFPSRSPVFHSPTSRRLLFCHNSPPPSHLIDRGPSRRLSVLTQDLWQPAAAAAVQEHLPFLICRKSHTRCSLKMSAAQDTNGQANKEEEATAANFVEVQIPVPWGHLAAKVWGKPNDNPILALHGWQDNAGTFDRLIPLLPSDLYIVCLDFSGHGLSSHYPPGLIYHYWDHIAHVRLVAAHFKWSRFSVLGHSLGGIVGSMFTAVFPQMVDKLVMIDIVKPLSTPAKIQPDKTSKAIEGYMQIMKKLEQEPPSYSYESARERLLAANNGSLDPVSAEVMMRRGTRQKEDGTYYFSRDLRHVIPSLASYTAEQHAEYAKRVGCPLLLIKANQGFIYEDKAVIEEFVKIYQQSSRGGFQYVQVDGTHHVQLVNPENVAPFIGKFLSVEESDAQPEN